MTPTRNPGPADAPEGTSGAATPPPPPPPPPPPGRPGAPGVPMSASAQAGARAAALRAAANTGKPPSKGNGATVVGAVGAAAAAAAAGYATYEFLIDDEDDKKDKDKASDEEALPEDLELLSATEDDSMDAFDDLGGSVGARFGGGGGRGGFGGGGGGGGERVVVRERPAPPRRDDAKPDSEADLVDIGEARAELLERFAAWQPPAGADPDEVAAFRTEIESLINRYQPREGMSANDALAELRQQFDDQVEDFVQELKLDAVIKDRDDEPMPTEPTEPTGGHEEPHWEWNAEKGRWEWDRGSEYKPTEPHWEWDADKNQWEWDDGPDPLPPAGANGFEWVPGHWNGGDWTPGHWERERARVNPADEDRPGLDWVPEHVDEYGRRVPGHWKAEHERDDDEPEIVVPGDTPDPINVPMPENAPVRHWVEGHYDEHGKYVKGHWEESSVEDPTPKPVDEDDQAPPPIIENPPTMPPPPTTPPVPPLDPPGVPTPPTPEPTNPTPPPDVRDHRDGGHYRNDGTWVEDPSDAPGGVVVRDHRGDRDRVRPAPRRRDDDGDDDRYGGGNVRDHRAGARATEPADGGHIMLPGPLQDVFENALPGRQLPFQQNMARQAPPDDAADADAATSPAGSADAAPVEAARMTPAASAEPSAPEPAPAAGAAADTAAPVGDDLLGVEAFADATAQAPELELAAEIPPPAPEPAPVAPAAPPAPAPEAAPAPAPAPVATVAVDPVPAEPPAMTEVDDLGRPPEPSPDDDETPSDLDNNPHTPL